MSEILLHYLWSIRKPFHHFWFIHNHLIIFGPSGIFPHFWFIQNLFIISSFSRIFSSSLVHPKYFHHLWYIQNLFIINDLSETLQLSLVRPQNLVLSGPSIICCLLWFIWSIFFSLASSRIFHFLYETCQSCSLWCPFNIRVAVSCSVTTAAHPCPLHSAPHFRQRQLCWTFSVCFFFLFIVSFLDVDDNRCLIFF